MKRTAQGASEDPDDLQDLGHQVIDKRSGKRATSAKGRRRNRRYENRLLNHQALEGIESAEDEFEDDEAASD
jgi:ribosomal 50S subunit-associated protein YjgA (DUF615 family)